MLLFPLKNFSLKHSRIVAKMNGFFGNFIMTVVDKRTCSQGVKKERGGGGGSAGGGMPPIKSGQGAK